MKKLSLVMAPDAKPIEMCERPASSNPRIKSPPKSVLKKFYQTVRNTSCDIYYDEHNNIINKTTDGKVKTMKNHKAGKVVAGAKKSNQKVVVPPRRPSIKSKFVKSAVACCSPAGVSDKINFDEFGNFNKDRDGRASFSSSDGGFCNDDKAYDDFGGREVLQIPTFTFPRSLDNFSWRGGHRQLKTCKLSESEILYDKLKKIRDAKNTIDFLKLFKLEEKIKNFNRQNSVPVYSNDYKSNNSYSNSINYNKKANSANPDYNRILTTTTIKSFSPFKKKSKRNSFTTTGVPATTAKVPARSTKVSGGGNNNNLSREFIQQLADSNVRVNENFNKKNLLSNDFRTSSVNNNNQTDSTANNDILINFASKYYNDNYLIYLNYLNYCNNKSVELKKQFDLKKKLLKINNINSGNNSCKELINSDGVTNNPDKSDNSVILCNIRVNINNTNNFNNNSFLFGKKNYIMTSSNYFINNTNNNNNSNHQNYTSFNHNTDLNDDSAAKLTRNDNLNNLIKNLNITSGQELPKIILTDFSESVTDCSNAKEVNPRNELNKHTNLLAVNNLLFHNNNGNNSKKNNNNNNNNESRPPLIN